MYVVQTGASRRSASARSSVWAPARSTPPPAHSTGRSAPASSSAARPTAPSGAAWGAAGVASRSSGTVTLVAPSSTSTGTSTMTGPCGAVAARR
jgi:hypothetical protein